MTFQTEILKSYSEKFCLVRMSCKITIDLTSIGSNLYTGTINKYVYSCYSNAIIHTKVSTPDANGEYSFNEQTGLVTIYSDSAITTAIVSCYLYLATDKNRAYGRDPLVNSDIIEWRGVLKEAPTFRQSIENLSSGVLTVNTSSLEIINNGEFDFLFDRGTSVNNNLFDVWFSCNGNLEKVFTGYLIDCKKNGFNLSIKTSDIYNKLNRQLYQKSVGAESVFTTEYYPQRDPNKDGLPIPLFFGFSSDFKTTGFEFSTTTFGNLDSSSLREAYCSSFWSGITTTTNRKWTLCRAINAYGSLLSATCSLPTSNYLFDLGATYDTWIFRKFDFIRVGTSTLEVVSFDGQFIEAAPVSGFPALGSCTVQSFSIPIIKIIRQDGSVYNLKPIVDYAITENVISTGILIEITFLDNFEAATIGAALDPTQDKVVYRASLPPVNQDAAVYGIASLCGITCDYTVTSSTKNICMGIPRLGDSSYQSALAYIEEILRSTVGYIGINLSGKLFYKQFSAPTSGVEINENDYLLGSLLVDEISQDAKTEIEMTPSCAIDSPTNKILAKSDSTIYLYDSSDPLKIQSTVEPIEITVNHLFQNLLKYNKYTFKTKTKGYGLLLGDSVKLNGIDLTVVGLDKSISGLEIVAVDTFRTV